MKHPIFHRAPRMAGLAALLMMAAGVHAQSPTSPEGGWDFVLSGSQKGVVQITFEADNTLSGTEVITTKPDPKNRGSSSNPREPRPGGIRVDGSTTNAPTTNVYFYGISPISGIWTYDNSGGVIGIIHEGDTSLTNGISFRGKRRGDRLNLVGHHNGRTLHYRGILLTNQADLSGHFYVTGNKNGEPFIETFTLAPDVTPNKYLVTGQGPAYAFDGVALLSGQNNLAIASIQAVDTNGVLSAVSGPYNILKRRGSLSGVSELHNRVISRVYKQPDDD